MLKQVILVKTVKLINRAARGSKTFRLDRMVNSFVFWRVPFHAAELIFISAKLCADAADENRVMRPSTSVG